MAKKPSKPAATPMPMSRDAHNRLTRDVPNMSRTRANMPNTPKGGKGKKR